MIDDFSQVEAAIAAIAAGEMVIVLDDEDRENEGDFICSAAKCTPEMVNFMITKGRGMLCVPMLPANGQRLQLEPLKSTGLPQPKSTNWGKLQAYADQIMVPADDANRADAGAGLTDND